MSCLELGLVPLHTASAPFTREPWNALPALKKKTQELRDNNIKSIPPPLHQPIRPRIPPPPHAVDPRPQLRFRREDKAVGRRAAPS